MTAYALLSDGENSKHPWPAQRSVWSKSFEIFCKTVFKAYCPLKGEGRENLPQAPYIICSNHASHIDSGALMVATGLPFKQIGLIAAKDYFFDTDERHFLRYLMNLVPIARGIGAKAVKDSIEASRSFLQSGGQALIIYPEGTRSISGNIAKFKEGAAILAHDLDLPMVPASVVGTRESLPKGAYFLRPGRVVVNFGVPLKVSDFIKKEEIHDRKSIFNAYREATAELERRVRELWARGTTDA